MIKTTIVASLDDSTVHPLYSAEEPEAVLAALTSGEFVACDSSFGRVWVSPSSVRYVQAGKARLPASSAPGGNSQSERRAMVSPTMG